MGNNCGTGGRRRRSPMESPSRNITSKRKDERSMSPEEMEEEHIHTLLNEIKEYHKERIRNELETDPHAFILDNILMCIQFFDNFEKSTDAANQYKRDTEKEMTELLAKDPLEGTILGDRRVKLLSGMSHVLAKNYIYRGKNPSDEEEADMLYGGMGFKDTFMAEGILPLEFTTTWENLEVYDASEWNKLKDYSLAKGEPPIARFCMEQPDKKMTFPKGFVRLRCVDEPIAFRRKLDIPDLLHPPSLFEDPLYSHAYSDVPEENSDTEEASSDSGPTSDDELLDSRKFTEMIKNTPSVFSTSKHRASNKENLPSTSKALSNTPNGLVSQRPKLPKLQLPKLKTEKNEEFPQFMIHAPTPPVRESLFEMQNGSSAFSYPHSPPGRILDSNSRSTPNLSHPSRDSPGKETSSGYDTTSTRSRASSMVSEMMRDKWQKLNLKKLWEFGRKSRKDEIPLDGRYDPLPQNCYSEIKYEFSYDDEHDEDDDDYYDEEFFSENESESYSEDGDLGLGPRKKRRGRNAEEEYEMRFYLNSLQVSSNACSEFHDIGPKLSIPPLSMSNGVVLGTSIRCPIAYSYPRDSKDEDGNFASYFVTHSFTPSLHSKSWPDRLYLHFNTQVFSFSKKTHSEEEMWPTRDQMDQIQILGCNAIPLGYRSVDFFNAEQILEWELKFHDGEAILLNSFKHSHWRAYIFAAVLSRAFIAPLGPQGIAYEHLRNIMYFMCHENFSGWNDEQPGLHLRILLDNLFSCLSRGHMPSFFVRSRNLLQSIPQHNLRFVQGHLNQIRENLLVYSIYAFRNLMDVRQKESYSLPNFKGLYEILTVEDTELLLIQNSILRQQRDQEDEEQRKRERERAMRKKKKSQTQRPNIIDNQVAIDRAFFASQRERLSILPPKRDKMYGKLHERYKRHLEVQQHKQKEVQKLQQNPELRLPEREKRKSIDLKKTPIIPKNFSPFRLLLTIQFFIKQFLKMAQRATELHCYDQATMYVFQVENLSEIMGDDKYRERLPAFSEDLHEYRAETLRLRAVIGKNMEQYILARLSFRPQSRPSISLPSLPGSPIMSDFPTFTNNWDLRKLPTPQNEIRPSGKRLSKPNIVSSLQSLDTIPPFMDNNNNMPAKSPSVPSMALSVVEEVLVTDSNRAPRRSESIKFVSPVLHRAASPTPATPHQVPNSGRILSRSASTFSLSLELEDTESTDL